MVPVKWLAATPMEESIKSTAIILTNILTLVFPQSQLGMQDINFGSLQAKPAIIRLDLSNR